MHHCTIHSENLSCIHLLAHLTHISRKPLDHAQAEVNKFLDETPLPRRSFLDLPLEIRLKVYRHLLIPQCLCFELKIRSDDWSRDNPWDCSFFDQNILPLPADI